MEFCPTCGNLLLFEARQNSRFFCRTCPYVCPIDRKVKITRGVRLPKAAVTPQSGEGDGKPTTSNPTAKETCEKCGHDNAEYVQNQTRSADEGPTTTFCCKGCGHIWNHN